MSDENKEISCPYCGAQITNDVEMCPNCNEFFVEPNLSEFKFVSVPTFLVFDVLLDAFKLSFVCPLFWIIFNYKNICNLAIQKDLKKFKILFGLFCTFVVLTLFFKIFIIADIIVEIFLSYRVLRIIEKFTMKKYRAPITHHEVGMILFRTLYIVYFLDTYLMRVKNPKLRYILNMDEWFKYSLIILGVIAGLYAVGVCSLPLLRF